MRRGTLGRLFGARQRLGVGDEPVIADGLQHR